MLFEDIVGLLKERERTSGSGGLIEPLVKNEGAFISRKQRM
jgi:hypothetical protein